jgi:hypothetical protein
MSIVKSLFDWLTGQDFVMYLGGGGGGGQPTQTTSYQTNIPEYAKPYVETMLGATQKQLFQGTPTEDGGFNITGFQPYRAYGGTYDEQGNQLSYDPGKAVAGFQPLQQQAQTGIANMQTPEQYGQAIGLTGQGIMGQLGTAGQGVGLAGLGYEAAGAGNRYAQQATNPAAMQAYMSPYMQNVVDVQQREAQRQADIAGTQRNAQAVRAGAFGGSRQAITDAEAARNLALQKGDIQATGLQSAFQQAQQAQQYGAGLGLQGLQAGMAGVGAGIGAQQAGYGQAMQGAGQLAGLGAQQLASQQGIYNLQNTIGAQQQALEQQKINQAMQDYANAQQYPLMQLGTMSNMLRGLPMQAQTTQQYAAAPNALTQAIGAAGAGASLYNAFNPPKGASGGLPKEFKKSGIMSYDVGGEVASDLENMDDAALQRQLRESTSPSIRRMAQRILRERQMEKGPGMAGGGIVAFAKGSKNAVIAPADDEESRRAQGILMAAPRPSGVVSDNPTEPAPPAPPIREQGIAQAQTPPPAPQTVADAIQSAKDLTPAMKAYQADVAKEAAVPIEDRIAEIQAAKKAAGIEPPNQDYRAKLMAERANAEDEAKRTRYLRLAEFFGRWGSTPGPTLAAGLASVKETIPTLISDEKEVKKIRMEIDKSIAGLDEATRLEQKGDYEAATAVKNKWAERTQQTTLKLLELQEKEAQGERADKRAEAADIRRGQREEARDIRIENMRKDLQDSANKTTLEAEKIRAAAMAGSRQAQNDANQLAKLNAATQLQANVEAKIANQLADPKYQALVADASLTGDSDVVKSRVAAAKAELENIRSGHQKMRETANTTLDYVKQAIGMTPPAAQPAPGNKPRVKGDNAHKGMPPLPPGAKLD